MVRGSSSRNWAEQSGRVVTLSVQESPPTSELQGDQPCFLPTRTNLRYAKKRGASAGWYVRGTKYVPLCLCCDDPCPTFGFHIHHAALSALSLTHPSAISCPDPEQEMPPCQPVLGSAIAKGALSCPTLLFYDDPSYSPPSIAVPSLVSLPGTPSFNTRNTARARVSPC